MTSNDLRVWQQHMGYTYDSAAEALGICRAAYANWIKKGPPAPILAGLACASLAAHRQPWTIPSEKSTEPDNDLPAILLHQAD